VKVRRSLLKSTVSVETYTGDGAYGPIYDPVPVIVRWNYDAKRRRVINANGDEAISEGSGTIHPDDAALFVPESRLTFDGRTSTVMATKSVSYRGAVSYVEVTCT